MSAENVRDCTNSCALRRWSGIASDNYAPIIISLRLWLQLYYQSSWAGKWLGVVKKGWGSGPFPGYKRQPCEQPNRVV